jgi:lysophospholipase L1-like esterase
MKWTNLFLAIIPFIGLAQQEQLNLGKNQLENQGVLLEQFKSKMDSLKNGKLQKVRILHIGDSHIQPDNFSGFTRKCFQAEYGNGGRGLVFPYTLAKTNGPKDFTATSSIVWNNHWIIKYPHKFKIGLPGIGIQSATPTGDFSIDLVKDSLKNPYTKGFVLYSFQDEKNGSISVNDAFKKKGAFSTFDTLQFDYKNPRTKLDVAFTGSAMTLHGVYVENEKPGVVYDAAGVAGARYRDFLRNEYFLQQMPLFQPDLIIISMGTNESYDPTYTPEGFRLIVDSVFNAIRTQLPQSAVIITLPSENYRMKDKVPTVNKRIAVISQILREESLKFGFSVWDLHEAMGGEGSMLAWKKAGLVNNDHIHYLRKGYNLQGQLLYDAINNWILKK